MKGRWKVYRVLLGCLLSSLPVYALTSPDTTEPEFSSYLHIGIPVSRRPYAYLDAQKQPAGFLIAIIQQTCQHIQANCQFTEGSTEQLLQDLRAIKLNAVLIVDDFLIPEVDKIKLTQPLCTIQPVFIHKAGEPTRNKPEDFRGSTLAMQEGSVFHIYLLDEYSAQSRLQPYPFMENAIFDLVFGRVDMLFTDQALFQTQIFNTALNGYVDFILNPVTTSDIPATPMTLAVREQDNDLFMKLETALLNTKAGQPCIEYLSTANVSSAQE